MTKSERRAYDRFLRHVEAGDDLNGDPEDTPRAELYFVERVRSARE